MVLRSIQRAIYPINYFQGQSIGFKRILHPANEDGGRKTTIDLYKDDISLLDMKMSESPKSLGIEILRI